MSKDPSTVFPYHLSEALREANIDLLELQEQILELAQSVPDYVGRLPTVVTEETH